MSFTIHTYVNDMIVVLFVILEWESGNILSTRGRYDIIENRAHFERFKAYLTLSLEQCVNVWFYHNGSRLPLNGGIRACMLNVNGNSHF